MIGLARTSDGYDERAAHAAMLQDLAAYKLPRQIIVLDDLPRHASGKSDYRRALEIALEELGLAAA